MIVRATARRVPLARFLLAGLDALRQKPECVWGRESAAA